jgi:hypothetical protein
MPPGSGASVSGARKTPALRRSLNTGPITLPAGISGYLVPAAVVGAISVGFGVTVAWASPSLAAMKVFAIAAVLIVPLVNRIRRGVFDPFEPLFLFALAYGTMFVIRPALTLASNDPGYALPYRTIDLSSTFDEMLVIALVGAIAFVAGYSSSIGASLGRRLTIPRRPINAQLATVLAAGVAAVALLSFAVFVLRAGGWDLILAGRSEALTQSMHLVSKYLLYGQLMLIPSCLVLLALGRRSRLVRAGGVATLCIAVVLALPIGNRAILLSLAIAIGVYFYISRGKRPGAQFLCVAGVVALATSAVTLDTRIATEREANGVHSAVSGIVENPERVVEPISKGDDAAMAPLFAAALTVIPEEMHHTYGRALFGDLLVRPIPRQWWSAKPEPPSVRVTDRLFPTMPWVNPEYSVLLVPYLDFGLAGVIALMVALGVGLRTVYAYFMHNASDVGAQLTFAATLSIVVSVARDSPVDSFTRAALVIGPLWLILRLARRPAQP